MTRQRILTAAIVLVGLIAILFWVQGGFHSKVPGGTSSLSEKTGPRPTTVKAEKVKTPGEVTVSGTVAARETARVAARIMGYVVELKVDAGDRVKKGDLLVRIDTKEIAEREAQAKASLESATAELVKARNDFEKYKFLFEKESVAKKDYDDALTRFETAQAAELKARAGLDEAKTMLSYGQVTAPFDGVVSARSVNIGDLATPGLPLLTLYVPGTVELVAAVGEQYAPFLKEGSTVRLDVPSLGLGQNSTIREVVPQRDEKTRTITVKAPLEQAAGLVPGLYGTLSFDTRASESIVIPKKAVKVIGQLEAVRVLEGGVEKTRHVKTGRTLKDDKVEILSGLNAGDEVVVD